MQEDSSHDIQDDELIRLVSSNANTSSQYVIFKNAQDEFYGINVAKVEELIMNKNISITKDANQEKNSISLGVSKIRGNLVTMLNFDDWLGNIEYTQDDQRLIILTNYSNTRLGMIIKSVVGIQSFESSDFDKNNRDEKTLFIVEIHVDGEKKLCKIFDSDRLLMDIFNKSEQIHEESVRVLDKNENKRFTDKIILFAEDSVLIQKHIKNLMDSLEYRYEIFENGKTLLDRLDAADLDSIGLIVTDIEMPLMDGMTLLKEIKTNDKYVQIPIIVNTNMVNSAIIANSIELGAKTVVKKLDMNALLDAVKTYTR